MVRAAGRLLFIAVIMLTVFGAAAAPDRQTGSLTPAIVEFTADTPALDYAAVEAGTAQVTLTWRTLNGNAQYRIDIDTYHQNRWISVLDSHEALQMNGTKLIDVVAPNDYGAPTFRMTLKTSRGQIVGRQYLTIPYASDESAGDPSIVSFTTPVEGVDTHLLVFSNAKINISWEIANRHPDTQLIFEQLFDPNQDGFRIDVTGYGSWLPSTGDGAIIPHSTLSKAALHYRLNLVSATDGTRYDWADITIPVIGELLIVSRPVLQGPGTVEPLSVAPAAEVVPAQASSEATGMGFSADTQSAEPGNIVLNWQAEDAANVQLLANVEDGPKTLFTQLPSTGSLSIPLPPDAPSISYTLRAQTADGTVTTEQLNVVPVPASRWELAPFAGCHKPSRRDSD